jgi:hypothetical protein
MSWRLKQSDLLFLVETLIPGSRDPEREADRLRADRQLLDSMLEDEQLFRRLMDREDILVQVSPWLFFAVLLRRARRDLGHESYTVERRSRQKVLLFDTQQVIDLLGQDRLRDYLAGLLASFTRIESASLPVRVGEGDWRWYRTNSLDVDSLMRFCQALDEGVRFEPYKRIADACLFLAGVFPEYIDAQYRYPLSGHIRPRARGRVVSSLEEYEAHGQAFYRLAAEHEMARQEGLDDVLATLSEHFVLAEKPLRFLADRYLRFARHNLFAL